HRDPPASPTRRSSDLGHAPCRRIDARPCRPVSSLRSFKQTSFIILNDQMEHKHAGIEKTGPASPAGLYQWSMVRCGFRRYLRRRSEEHTSELQSRENL